MLRVILADDEKKICQLLRVLVNWEQLGFEIIGEEHDGLSLLQATREQKPDVIITDIRMPGMSGLEMLHAIRGEQMDIDIIMMSGYREFDYVRTALRDGASDYLLKPIGRQALQDALEKIRARHDSAVESQRHLKIMEQQLETYSQKLQQDLVREILEGHLRAAQEEELNRKYGCHFQQADLYFAAVKVDFVEPLQKKTDEVARQKCTSIIEEEMKKRNISFHLSGQGNFRYMLFDANTAGDLDVCLHHLIYELKDFFCKWDAGHVTIGLAPVVQGQLYDALEKSRAAARDQIFRGVDKVLTYRTPQSTQPSPVWLDKGQLEQLRSSLRAPDAVRLNELTEQVLRHIRDYGSLVQSGDTVYTGMQALQRTIQENCRSLYAEPSLEDILERSRTALDSCWDWNTYQQVFAAQNEALAQSVLQHLQQTEKRPIRRMKQILQERYREDLSLECLAAELELSPAYVSKMFKKELDVTFSQYLNAIRLEHAKQLLISSNDSAVQIADAIGYHDEKYFLRIFKREVGLTTSEYRRLYGE